MQRTSRPTLPAARHEVGGAGFDELIEMFPSLEPALIAAIERESRTRAAAVETLLVLAGGAEHLDGPTNAPSAQLRLQTDDHEIFPVFLDADGWQVWSPQASDTECGKPTPGISSWSERAKAVAQAPTPKARERPLVAALVQRPQAPEGGSLEGGCGTLFDDGVREEYELRHLQGQRREARRARLRHRRGSGAAQLAVPVTIVQGDGGSDASEDTDVVSAVK